MSAVSAVQDREDTSLGGALHKLWSDPLVRVFVVLEALVLAPYFLPWTTPGGMETYAELFATVPTKLAVLLALLYRPGRKQGPAESRFWRYLAGAYACWLAIEVLDFSMPSWWTGNPRVEAFEDLLFIGFYLLVALALEVKPHRGTGHPEVRRLRFLRAAGAVVFAMGLLAYFAVLPREFGGPPFTGHVPSLFLYLIMDLYIVIRAVSIRHECRDRSWRAVYGFLIVTAALWTTFDLIEMLFYTEVLPWVPMGTLLDIPWHLPYFAIVLTARVREVPAAVFGAADRRASKGVRPAWGGTPILYAVAFPLIHFTVNAIGISDSSTQGLREIFVSVVVLALATIALLHHKNLAAEKRRLEQANREFDDQLQLSQRMEAVGRLAGGIAHDFNNVLQVVRGCSEMARDSLDPRAPERVDLEMISEAVDRAAGLTDRLLTVSRRRRTHAQPLDLNRIVSDTGIMLERMIGEDIELTVETDPALQTIHADRGEIEQVLMNLCVNARDAMCGGGTLEVRTVAVNDGESIDHSMLVVRDSGHGMDKETRSHIFEPFFTSKRQGTGLGLSMVYGIVTRCGGRIDVDSALGNGTTFRILFPVHARPTTMPSEVRPEEFEAPGGSESVLVVEDEEEVRVLIARHLESLGYEVQSASGGLDALTAVELRPRPFDILLTDVVMPGMRGPELAGEVRRRHPETRVIYMSGYVGDALDSADPESEPLLRKPFTREALARELRTMLETRQPT